MKINHTVNFIVRKASQNQLISFDYTKDDGSKSKRTLRVGVNVEAKFEREGNPIKKIGNWASDTKRKGKNNCIILRGGEAFVQGSEMSDKGRFKYFKLANVENLH